ncbi:MAG TPA: pilus assembly protein, partial [Acidimicrobiia bacterium]|nr:pilus assembly protein [Acidimicrobiia bacterium]
MTGFLKRKPRDDRGAALIEFALLMPLLIILILGIVEFGWKFGQFNDVRHAA